MGISAFLFIVLAAILAIYSQSPPDAASEDAPLEQFSSARAIGYLRPLSAAPRPVGTTAHDEARRFIIDRLNDIGIVAEVQEATPVSRGSRSPFAAGTVRNVVARLAGSDSTRALMIAGHYDSVANSRGAGDNGSAVAAMIETARALKSGPALKNDIIFLFTDGEEAGLLGAKGFVEEHPWSSDVGLVLNFDARGNSGPSIMFEASPGNGWLVRQLASATPFPNASSLTFDLYRLLPNETDLTVFKQAGIPGMNFAFIEGSAYYHSPADVDGSLDERSLQHQGYYMLSLARHIGNIDLTGTRASDAVYFNVPGPILVHYPVSWTIPLIGAVVAGLIGLTIAGFRKRYLSAAGVAMGAAAFLVELIAAAGVAYLAWTVIGLLYGGYTDMPQGDTYNSIYYIVALALLGTAAFMSLYSLFRKRIGFHNLVAGALAIWMLVTVAISIYIPGASYLFLWPMLSGLFAWGLTFGQREIRPVPLKRFVALCLLAVPAVILFAPVIRMASAALTVSLFWPVILLLGFSLGALIPQLELICSSNRWALAIVVAVAGVSALATACSTSSFDDGHPKPNSIFYVLDTDQKKAIWASTDRAPDRWTSQFLSSGVQRGTMFDYFPLSPRLYMKSEAPVAALPAPEVTLLDDTSDGEWRNLRLKVRSARLAPVISIYVDSDGKTVEAAVNGKPAGGLITRGSSQFLAGSFHGLTPEGFELTVKAPAPGSLKVKAVDRSYGLADTGFVFEPRRGDLIAAPLTSSDSIFVSKTFTF
jgi:hypothetical protein